MKRVLLIGNYGGHNLGDDAMLYSLLFNKNLKHLFFNVLVKDNNYNNVFDSSRIIF